MDKPTIITFLSDWGLKESLIGLAHFYIQQLNLNTCVIDISHKIEQNDLHHATYLIESSLPFFPKGTIHILALNLFLQNETPIILTRKDGQFFISSDNGLLSMIFEESILETWVCKILPNGFTKMDWIKTIIEITENILHQSIKLSHFTINFNNLYVPYVPHKIYKPNLLLQNAKGISCDILFINNYNNVIINIKQEKFEKYLNGKKFRIKMVGKPDITTISNNYADVPIGYPLCFFNCSGFLEIAINRENAAEKLGLSSVPLQQLIYSKIKILIEN